MTCVDCHSPNASLYRGDDGRHRKKCHDCGYQWGPFTSPTTMDRRENNQNTQPSLTAYSAGTSNGDHQ